MLAALAALALVGCGASEASPASRSAGEQPVPAAGGRHLPTTLQIDAIGVRAPVEQVGVDGNGNMAIPADPHDVGWYAPGAAPGQPGNAVIDGHLDWYGMPQGPFYRLDALRPGDEVDVQASDGTTLVFQVSGPATSVPADARPSGLFSTTGSPSLTLITCGGQWDASKHTYTERRLVNAALTSEATVGS